MHISKRFIQATGAVVLLGSFFSTPSFAANGKKALIVYDMEGVTGADTAGDYDTDSPDYARVRQSLTDDINAVVEGLKKAGVTEIVISDCHASGNALEPDYLMAQIPAGARFDMRDKPYDPYVIVDKSYDAMVMVGMHAYSGSKGGFTPHTYFGTVQWEMNGLKMSETSEVAFSAASIGIPLILVSGDDVHKAQVAEFSKAEYVVTKKALSSTKAEPRDRAVVSKELADGAETGFKHRKEIGIYKLPAQVDSKWIFPYSELAAMASNYPGVTIVNDKTVEIKNTNYMDAMLAYRSISNFIRYCTAYMMIEQIQQGPDGAAKYKAMRAGLPPRDYTPGPNALAIDNKLNKWGYQ
jgi:D-amino peptidase